MEAVTLMENSLIASYTCLRISKEVSDGSFSFSDKSTWQNN
jgi:hypothetical protein